MATHRANHRTEDIKRGIISIIPKLKDPRLKEGLISVVTADVSSDGGSCHIFISSIEGIDHSAKACEILNGASGFIRKKLGSKLKLRYVPNLVFSPTDTIEYAFEMSKKIETLMNPQKRGGTDEINVKNSLKDFTFNNESEN